MTTSSELSILLSPLLELFEPESVLLIGTTAVTIVKDLHNTRSEVLTKPFQLNQLKNTGSYDLAIVSEITGFLSKREATEWIGSIRNYHSTHVILITDRIASRQKGWQFSDFLALGLKLIGSTEYEDVYSYAIESYQPQKEWLNNRFWANPENYGKYRW
jgi:hypothetical protein